MNFVRAIGILFLVLAASLLSACGPEDSRREEINNQRREDYQKDKARLEPAIGSYYGVLDNSEMKKNYAAKLVIKHVTILVTQPSSGDVVRIPSLGGELVLLADKDSSSDKDISVGTYTVGDYDPQTGQVSLWSQNSGNGGSPLFSFTGVIRGNVISGEVTTPMRNGMKFEGTRE